MTSAAATQFLSVVAPASAVKNALVVSIHDVAPCNRSTVQAMLDRLLKYHITTCSLLVVPDYHHQNPIEKDPAFLGWLRELQDAGHEIVIHGYFHQRPRAEKESLRAAAITRFYTHDEGEFFDLTYDEAFRRITAAREIFIAGGLRPHGFIAPAWLLHAEGERAARDAGMEYTTRLRTVVDLGTGEHFAARSLVYSVRNHWRRVLSRAWNGLLHRVMQETPLLRLSLHPPDYSFPRVWAQVERFLPEMSESRTATNYQTWIAERRLQKEPETKE